MMRSMFSGVSGLKAHQAKMDVIGNNIANVNTVGYKGQTVSFQEVFAQTIKGGGSPQGGRGGTNPQSIGLGVNIASMDVQHTQGSTQRTDNPTDVMIDGNGFFVVSNDGGQNKFYTRAGNFSVDVSGNLVTPGGFKVLGQDGSPIVIDKTTTQPASASGPALAAGLQGDEWALSGNISVNDTTYTTTVNVYDSVGGTHKLNVNFGNKVENATSGTYYRPLNIVMAGNPNAVPPVADVTAYGETNLTTPATPANAVYAFFKADGTFDKLVLGDPTIAAPASVAAGTNITLNYPGVSNIVLPITQTTAGLSNMFSKVTSNNSLSNITGTQKYGNAPGSIDNFNISGAGEVVATYTNGVQETLATIALAGFDNPAGLKKMGSNLFTKTPNSGDERLGTPGAGSFGALVPGALEMSNVDLSQQFTEMITTQRGFQANAKIITTSDEILQELVNLKR